MSNREKDPAQQTPQHVAGIGPEAQVADSPLDQSLSEWSLLKRDISELSEERKARLSELSEKLRERRVFAIQQHALKGPVPPGTVILDDGNEPPIFMIAGRSVGEWLRAVIECSATPDEFIARVDERLASREGESLAFINSRISELVGRLPTTVLTVVASYSGSGDSGEFEEITFLDEAQKSVKVDAFLNEEFEELFYDLLAEEHAGWGNDDGASGTMTLNVPEKFIDIEHTSYFTDSSEDSTRLDFTV
jgi:hypothetical protein